MGALRAYSQRRTANAAGGFGGLVKSAGGFLVRKVAPLALRAIPGLGPVAAIGGGALAGAAGRRMAAPVIRGATQLAHKGARAVQTGVTGSPCGSGYHLAKDGSGRCVRNRSMNAGNARAAKRAVRRIKAAEKLFRQILTVQGKPHAGIKPKARRR